MLNQVSKFNKALGKYLKKKSKKKVNIRKKKIAMDISIRGRADVRIIAGLSNSVDETLVEVNGDTTDTDIIFRGSVFISRSSFNNSENILYTSVYREPNLFVDNSNSVVDSFIISVSINDEKASTLLSDPIKLTFKKTSSTEGESSCVYWEFLEGMCLFETFICNVSRKIILSQLFLFVASTISLCVGIVPLS